MNQTIIKNALFWIIILGVFIFGFYLYSHRNNLVTSEKTLTNINLSSIQETDQDLALKQKLAEDFENAFLKQYTPLLGCEVLHNKNKDPKCIKHLEQSKNDFKQEFIRNRGLPKNTFEELNLSSVE